MTERRSGHSRLDGRPLDENGGIELRVEKSTDHSAAPPVGAEPRRTELKELRATVKSLAMMLGWENVPPRDTLERSISALKALAAPAAIPKAGTEADDIISRLRAQPHEPPCLYGNARHPDAFCVCWLGRAIEFIEGVLRAAGPSAAPHETLTPRERSLNQTISEIIAHRSLILKALAAVVKATQTVIRPWMVEECPSVMAAYAEAKRVTEEYAAGPSAASREGL